MMLPPDLPWRGDGSWGMLRSLIAVKGLVMNIELGLGLAPCRRQGVAVALHARPESG